MPLSQDPDKRARQLANLQLAPPAPAGHQRAVSHGAYAQIARADLEEKVAAVYDALSSDAPVRDGDGTLPAADGPAIRMLAEALCRLDRIQEYLDRRGWEDSAGKPRPVLEYEARLRAHSLDLLKELGMTPASRAKLGLDLVRSMDLASAMSGGGDA
jgi:Phage terminase, small subunit